jgi:FAD/FMN-containing dehydrogenase
LPIDPPNPDNTSIADILNANSSGPRRFGYGTIREHLIGLKVVLADGRIIKAGGKVVKNVAGYDLCKLFVGSRRSLGAIVEATFKLRPLPEAEQFLQASAPSLEQADQLLGAVLESELTPVVLDLHNLSTLNSLSRDRGDQPATSLVLGFAGTREEVEWQLQKARALGVGEHSTLDYQKLFWAGGDEVPVRSASVLPSRLAEMLLSLAPVSFVARAGNGAIFYRGGAEPPKDKAPVELTRRIKETYDPKNIFPDFAL